MKVENPVQYRLKCTTYEIISDMYNTGKYRTYKDACFYFFNRVKIKKVATGFKMTNQELFYNSYRNFKHHKKITEKNKENYLEY